MRTLVIGDIHGGLRALVQVVERAGVTPGDTLIFLGDYVDGWSESAQVIDHLVRLSTEQDCVFLKGNHDAWCEEWLRTGEVPAGWLSQGGRSTVESYRDWDEKSKQAHIQFFEQLGFYKAEENKRLFVHAGYTSDRGPVGENDERQFYWDRELWQTALAMDKKLKQDPGLIPKKLKLFDEIFIGHTPTLYLGVDKPVQACNVWNIDTGAAFTGKLTLIDADTKEYWQSDRVSYLYPGEYGRNRPG